MTTTTCPASANGRCVGLMCGRDCPTAARLGGNVDTEASEPYDAGLYADGESW